MKRLYERYGFSEHVDLDDDDSTSSPDLDLTDGEREPVGAGAP